MTQTVDFLAPLDDFVVLRIHGQDARAFLHAQLSNDISGMGLNEARLAAYCTPKGRMLGSMVIWAETEDKGSPLLALLRSDIVEPLLKRLRMFVLRSKVTFEPSPLQAFGASSASSAATTHTPAPEASEDTNSAALTLEPAPAWQLRRCGTYTLVSAPSASANLARWWVIPQDEQDITSIAGALGLNQGNAAVWRAQDIEAGLGWVEEANQELFIPQSLNFDLNGGVSFTKGCYPGQEVVARAHFRGAVKRRAVPGYCRLPSGVELKAGMDVFDAGRPGSPAGRIINAVKIPDDTSDLSQWYIFMEINLGDLDQVDFRANSAEGSAIKLLALPYSLDAKTAG
ncbi:MAG TPA: folate-binding protein [Burkholderiaceae bacterium]|nr:folate-binding protein [Burkholderiaceae bacterium]